MKLKISIVLLITLLTCCISILHAAGLEKRPIKITSNERFDFIDTKSIQFKFQPLTEEARNLEITNNASSLGVAYLGQVQLKENITALSALRSIADQIGESLDLSFGIIADSNTSEALKANELILLYHPDVTITLALAKVNEQSHYEIICTYALKDTNAQDPKAGQTTSEDTQTTNVSSDKESTKETNKEATTDQ